MSVTVFIEISSLSTQNNPIKFSLNFSVQIHCLDILVRVSSHKSGPIGLGVLILGGASKSLACFCLNFSKALSQAEFPFLLGVFLESSSRVGSNSLICCCPFLQSDFSSLKQKIF